MLKNPASVSQIHGESGLLADKMQQMAMKEGYNMVIPEVGSNQSSIEKQIEMLKAAGYTVNLTLVQLDLTKAMQRNMGRYESMKLKGEKNEIISPK